MEIELLNIFDEGRKQIGVAPREDVHRKGYWHETFHCWFIQRENDKNHIYFQNRSKNKKDYPDLLDITAAGHLLSHESVMDGIREVEEELGINVAFEELVPLGVIDYSVEKEDFIDKELAHVFLYRSGYQLDDFNPQLDEVSGIVRIAMEDFYELWFNGKKSIESIGFKISNGKRVQVSKQVTKDDFVPHEDYYYRRVLHSIRELETEKC